MEEKQALQVELEGARRNVAELASKLRQEQEKFWEMRKFKDKLQGEKEALEDELERIADMTERLVNGHQPGSRHI